LSHVLCGMRLTFLLLAFDFVTFKMTRTLFFPFLFFYSLILLSCTSQAHIDIDVTEKVNGVNFVSPPAPILVKDVSPIQEIGANWITIIPYAFTDPMQAQVSFGKGQWWGEKPQGVSTLLTYAQQLGLKVMLKPHLWVLGQGWAGDLSFATDVEWSCWEKEYTHYILTYAKLAQQYECDIFCIGTEMRQSVKKRSHFWGKLIRQVKNIYQGRLTYAANWDNYTHVSFWKELDYIGIDAYFPLSRKKNPSPMEIEETWKTISQELKSFSEKNNMPILFTEYGYRSIEYTTKSPWVSERVALSSKNDQAQCNAYEALFETFWNKKWFAGGFLWKWYPQSMLEGSPKPTGYSPQGKKAIKIIKKYYVIKD